MPLIGMRFPRLGMDWERARCDVGTADGRRFSVRHAAPSRAGGPVAVRKRNADAADEGTRGADASGLGRGPSPKATSARAGTLPADAAAFTKQLCRHHRMWVIDETTREELPEGWHDLARTLFAQIAAIMAVDDGGALIVRRLGEEAGGFAADLRPLGERSGGSRAFRAVQRLLETARRTSEETCSLCGGPGRVRVVPEGWYAARCDAHVGATEVDLGSAIGEERRPAERGREDARMPVEGVASAVVAWEHRLYDVADVEAAVGRRKGQGGSSPGAASSGDPDDHGTRDPDNDQQTYLRALLVDGEEACRRTLAGPGPATLAALDDLHARAPHMAEVTALVRRHLKAAITMGLPTSLPALMLLGEPGTGKTWYLSRLATLLGVPHRRYAMSGQSLAGGLIGTHPTWRNAQPGLVAKCLLAERLANPLVVVDEVDKGGTSSMEDPYRGFYDLLEPENARNFSDEYLGFPMDASRVLWVLAGNDLAPIPGPIVDRLTVVGVPTPDGTHLRAVAASIYEECNGARRHFFPRVMGDGVIARLLATNPRGIRKAIAEAMTRAAADGRASLREDDVVVTAPPRRMMGFR